MLAMLVENFLPEPFIRLAAMISLTAAFGGSGFLFVIAFIESTIPKLPVEYFGKALAIGIALVILLVSGLNSLGIPLTKTNLSITFLSLCGVCILRLIQKRPRIRSELSLATHHNRARVLIPISLFFILLVLRTVQLRDIFVPNGYDGLIHTSRLLDSITQSAIPLDNLYQVGFYAITLVAHFFSGLALPETVLLSGQWLSVVCGLSFFIFASRYIYNPYAAGLSFAAYSFILFFPSSLISWSRYPYLLGLALLPPAIISSQDWLNNRKSSFLAALILVISLGLTHYGLLLIWFSFIMVYLINNIAYKKKIRWEALERRKTVFLRPHLLIFPALAIILTNTFNPLHHSIIHNGMLSQVYDPDFGYSTQYVLSLFRGHDFIFIFIAAFWALWSLVWKRKLLYLTLFWPLAVWFSIWIQHQTIGRSILSYGNLIVFLAIPLALSLGLFAQQLFLWLIKLDALNAQPLFRHRLKSRLSILSSITILVFVLISPLSIDHKTTLFSNEDMLAMKWISQNTAKDSGFLIRSISRYENGLIPRDGGGWITFLTGRRTVIPQTGELYDICEFAANHGVSYVYFGKQGANDSFDLRLTDLNGDNYTVVYGNRSVEIASLRCP